VRGTLRKSQDGQEERSAKKSFDTIYSES